MNIIIKVKSFEFNSRFISFQKSNKYPSFQFPLFHFLFFSIKLLPKTFSILM